MTIFVMADSCFVEVSYRQFLYICSTEEFEKLSATEKVKRVEQVVADYRYQTLNAQTLH